MRKPKTSDKTSAEQLKEAAVRLFAKYGYEGTTVRAIAKEAGFTAGQITANFKSKENLFNEIIMDIYEASCRQFDPLIGEYEYLKREGKLTPEDVWRLIEQIIDNQIQFALDRENFDLVRIIHVHALDENMMMSEKLRQATKSRIEGTLAALLREVFKNKRTLHVKTISRAVNGAIVTFAEFPELLLYEVLSSRHMPQSMEWMKMYIKNFIMDSLRHEAERELDDQAEISYGFRNTDA